jgi:hypothetical protein
MKKIKITKLGAGLLLAGLLSTPNIVSATIVDVDFGSINNGTFERLDPTATFGPADQVWTVSGNNVDYITGYWQSPNGSNASGPRPDSVDLEGAVTGGSISTTINVDSSDSVTINFSLAGNPDAGPGVKQGNISVGLGGAVQDLSYTVTSANNDANMGWIAESVTFSGIGTGLQTLTFSDTDPNTGFGLVIGNAAVPEPTTMVAGALMLLPLGVSAMRIMRKSRIA